MLLRQTILALATLPAVVCPPLALTQNAPTTDSTPISYLLRLERSLPREHVCALVRGDGQYHWERATAAETIVYEGTLDSTSLRTLGQAVSGDELFHLRQAEIAAPLVVNGLDRLEIEIFRPGYLQVLRFSSPDVRKPYRHSLDPLLKWLNDAPKERFIQQRDHSTSNNCLPPAPTGSKASPVKPDDANQAAEAAPVIAENVAPDFLVRIATTHVSEHRAESTCSIVYRTGLFHSERAIQELKEPKPSVAVFEDSVAPAQLDELRKLLDNPDLHDATTQGPPNRMVEGEITKVAISRKGSVQNLTFWRSFDYRSTGLQFTENGVKALKPLDQWMKTNVAGRNSLPLKGAATTNCAPVKWP